MFSAKTAEESEEESDPLRFVDGSAALGPDTPEATANSHLNLATSNKVNKTATGTEAA